MNRLAVGWLLLALAGCGTPTEPRQIHGKSVEHWLESIKAADAKTRKRAADVLGNVGAVEPAIVPALAAATRDRDRNVREAAILALLKIGPAAKEAMPALDEASRDPDAKVRSYAAKALENLRAIP